MSRRDMRIRESKEKLSAKMIPNDFPVEDTANYIIINFHGKILFAKGDIAVDGKRFFIAFPGGHSLTRSCI